MSANPDYGVIIFLFEGPLPAPHADARIQFIQVDSLDLTALTEMRVWYSPSQFSWALKPYLALWIFDKWKDCAHLVYLDADIYVLGSFRALEGALQEYEILLSPHLLSPIPQDGKYPEEDIFLVTGTFNGGFFALSRGVESDKFLHWWQEHTYQKCIQDRELGYWDDQKWLNLVPGLFGKVAVWRDPGYNVAYWNLHERRIVPEGLEYEGLRYELIFYHYSGLQLQRMDFTEGYQNRTAVAGYEALLQIFNRIKTALLANGWQPQAEEPPKKSLKGLIKKIIK